LDERELRRKEEELRRREEEIRRRERELGIEGRILAEISRRGMTLIKGMERFTVPRQYCRAVYDTMQEAIRLGEDEMKTVELQPKETKRRGWIPW